MKPHQRVRFRVLLFPLSAILILSAFYLLASISDTLNRLTVVEAERDRWQRPAEVVRALGSGDAKTVVDLGSGAGYFSLKLADAVGSRGEVVAVDLRRVSLFFLRIRALLRNRHNIRIIVGTPDDPGLPPGAADAVLISNTYHEFARPQKMLEHVFRSLRGGGRLVIIDRGPPKPDSGETGAPAGHHSSPGEVEGELSQRGFEILDKNDRFIDRPGDEPWWLLVARRP